jgi:hypothetical protein
MSILPRTWPEIEFTSLQSRVKLAWATLEDELAELKAAIRAGVQPWPVQQRSIHGSVFGSFRDQTVDEMSLTNMAVLMATPTINSYVVEIRRRARQLGLSATMQQQQESQFVHQTHHLLNWAGGGKKVYYLDDVTYQLLAHTPLPKLPMSVLTAPVHSFYLVLPPSAFKFGVEDDSGPAQRCSGIMVTMDNIQPDAPTRELAVFCTGESKDHGDSNVAYFVSGMGEGANLNDITFGGGKHYGNVDPLDYLKVTVPRVVIGLLLYLASEHPDVEPVPPVKRETYSNVRSPKQREAALRNQEDRLKKVSRLGYLHVGKRIGDAIRAHAPDTEEGRYWKLDHQVWVGGHHKMQSYGPNHMYRRPIWIQPYIKGPDTAEAMVVKLRKVQTAQEA